MVNIDPTLGSGGAARSYTRSAVAAAQKKAEEERLAEEARLAAEKLPAEKLPAEKAAAPQTGDLFTDQKNYPGLRAQPQTTNAEGQAEIWGIYKNAQGEWDWEKIGVQGADDGDSKSVNAFKQWTISQQQATQAAAEAGLESAQQILAGLVADFGLPATLAAKLNAELVRGESPTALAMRIRTTDEYKARFPGMAKRREHYDAEGNLSPLPAISETEYLNIERQYRSVMQAAKLPSTFHDEPADFTEWIAGDVSPQEFQERVVLAETARDSADAETRRLLSDFYDISDGDLTAYYLDPGRAETIFEDRRRLESAGLAAASRQTVGQALEMETAEALQAESVQRREIQQRLGQRAGLTGELLGSEAMTASEIAEGEFGLDVEAIATLRRRREGRVAGFRGTAGALTTGAGITGFGAAE